MSKKIFDFARTHQYVLLVVIAGASFFASFAYSFYFQIQPIVDARFYNEVGWELAQGKPYSVGGINRPGPGYEYFLALIYFIFGHSYFAVWVAQSLLLALMSVLIFFVSKFVFGTDWHPFSGLVAAAFVGFSPDLITLAAMMMTETFTIFAIVAALAAFFRYLETRSIFLVPLTAILLSIAALTRGNTILLILPVAAFFVLEREWRRGAVFVLAVILCLIPWTLHNYRIYGQIKPFNASAGLLYVGNHDGATGELVPDYPMPPGVDPNVMSQLEFDDALGRAGKRFILENPAEFFRLSFLRASIYFSLSRPTGWWPHLTGWPKWITVLSSALHSAALFIVGFFGVWLAIRSAGEAGIKKRARYLFALGSMLPLSVMALVVETRYRVPLYPILAVFAGYGSFQIIKEGRGLFKVFVLVVSPLFLNTIFDVVRNWERIAGRLFNS